MLSAIILAAGLSSRFGKPKLLLPLNGKSLIRWTAERVADSARSQFNELIVVVGWEAAAVLRELEGLDIRTIFNPRFAVGMSTSLIAGLQAMTPENDGAMIFLGDQPLVSPEVVCSMIATFRKSEQPIVVPVYNGVRGNPVLFSTSLFPELMAVEGDKGGRDVVMRSQERVATVAFPSGPLAKDIDTWDDYQALRAFVELEEVTPDPGLK